MKRAMVGFLLSIVGISAAELPIQEVVLYKHGVGFFKRSGRLKAGESARLDFTAAEMNDVLKSLTVEDTSGGKIGGLRYDSMDPLSHTLEAFPFQIGSAQPLPAVLDQLKGARVEILMGGGTLAGAIVSARLAPAADRQPERQELTLLLDGGELRTLDLSAASGIHFTDGHLQQQFRDYLSALAAARLKDRRSVYIESATAAARDIVASYTIPTAVWKSSYRLIFGAEGKPMLEGWAIVDNTTADDWNRVRLSLVSGRPISFVSQLYAPQYVQRPAAELPTEAAARPVLHEGGFGVVGGVPGVGGQAPAPLTAKSNAGARLEAELREANPAPSLASGTATRTPVAPSTIASNAEGREMGDLFEYRITQPVTIQRGQSAMLPFLQQPIEARKLLIYSDHGSQHPTNAAELSNSSGRTLDGGPITIYDGGGYAGEALMETLKAGDKRLISYAVDLGTRITEAFNSKQAVVREIHLKRGILTTRTAAEETRTYTIKNVDQKAKTLILEHPLRPGYTLLNQKPTEKTPDAYRFEIALAPGASQEFPVNEERLYEQSYAVINLTPDLLLSYVQNRTLPDAAKRGLQQIADQKAAIAANDRSIEALRKQIQDASSDEERIRQNIRSLNSVTSQQQLVQAYARQLDQREQELAQLRDRQAELEKKKATLEGELNQMMENLAF